MEKPYIIIGGGGHAKVLIDTLKLLNADIIGIVDNAHEKLNSQLFDIPVIGNDYTVASYNADSVKLVNAIGSVSIPYARKAVFDKFKQLGYSFATVIHPTAVVSHHIIISEGVQIMAGAIIQAGFNSGVNTIINTGCVIDHDCSIGDHTHVAPGVTISGGVTIGETSHIGTAAVLIQGVSIGKECLVAAGAVVVRNTKDCTRLMGVPARIYT